MFSKLIIFFCLWTRTTVNIARKGAYSKLPQGPFVDQSLRSVCPKHLLFFLVKFPYKVFLSQTWKSFDTNIFPHYTSIVSSCFLHFSAFYKFVFYKATPTRSRKCFSKILKEVCWSCVYAFFFSCVWNILEKACLLRTREEIRRSYVTSQILAYILKHS